MLIAVEVGYYKEQFLFAATEERIYLVAVVGVAVWVGILQVVEFAALQCFAGVAKCHYFGVECLQFLLLDCQLLAIIAAVSFPAAQCVNAPVIENGSAAIDSAVALFIQSSLAKFLSCIQHEGLLAHCYRHDCCSFGTACICSKEIGCDTLLVVVLEECEHVGAYVRCVLQGVCDGVGRYLPAHYSFECVVKAYLVVKVVEATVLDECAVYVGLVYLANKYNAREFLFYLGNGPCPELNGCHLYHVATETIDTTACPVAQNLQHLDPCIGNGRELAVARTVVDTVIQFHGVVPVVARR